MLTVLGVAFGLFWLALPLFAWFGMLSARRELREFRSRLDAIERDLASRATPSAAARAPQPDAPPASAPAPSTPSAPGLPPPAPATLFAPLPRAAEPPPRQPEARTSSAAQGLEDRVGSVWLQNVGAVVLLLGVFFFILWGYTTGRFGAGVLVVSGIVLGLLFAAYGDRQARSLPRLGHALIGTGLGIVYLSIYLGHFTLHVMSRPLAAVLTMVVAFATIGAGMRYRVQTIAAIGVIGAFLPQLLVAWLGLRGFGLEPAALLGYLALVDILVFALAARAGWSALDLAALLLTTFAWQSTFPNADWGGMITLGLAALFTGLGLAPLPRLLRVEGRVRDIDLAVVAGAPVLLLVSVWGALERLPTHSAAMVLFALSVVQWLAALWVDRQRTERDLWRPLTGAAIVFLTAGLHRWAGPDTLALTWALEGILLVLLGLAPRSGWLRACGHTVLGLAALATLYDLSWWQEVPSRIVALHPGSLRGAGLIALLGLGAELLARRREALAPLERWAPEAWASASGLLYVLWSNGRCHELASALPWPSDPWWAGSGSSAPLTGALVSARFEVLRVLAWTLPAVGLAWRGARAGRGFLRAVAYGFALLALGAQFMVFAAPDRWAAVQWPVLHPTSLGVLLALALMFSAATRLAARRAQLSSFEQRAPEVWAGAYLLVLLLWTAHESGHAATALLRDPSPMGGDLWVNQHTLAAALTSAAWLIEAVSLLALGWLRATAFLRWAGLLLMGVIMVKFTLYDLAEADVFWRFLTAIAAGAAMLMVSYAYQRRARSRRAGAVLEPPAAAD